MFKGWSWASLSSLLLISCRSLFQVLFFSSFLSLINSLNSTEHYSFFQDIMYLQEVKYNAASVKRCGFSSCLLLLTNLMQTHGTSPAGESRRSLQNQGSHFHKENLREDKSPLLKPSLWDFFFFLNPRERRFSGRNHKSEVMINMSL